MHDLIDSRPIWTQRKEMGLSTPMPAEKRAIWAKVTVPQARIFAAQGGYKPFHIVDRAHDHPARSILVAGGIRGSKSVSAAMEAVSWAPHSDLIWFGADSYDLARMEFEYTAEAMLSLGWTRSRMVNLPENRFQPCSLETIWGTLIETRTLHDVSTFVARAPDLIVICEPGLAQEAALQRASERLATRRGRLYLPGTFEEVRYQWMEDYWRKWIRWPNEDNGKSFTVPSWMNTTIFPKGKYDPEIGQLRRRCKDFNEFLRRVVGVPSQIPDIIFSDSFNRRLHAGKVSWLRREAKAEEPLPVWIAVDPGYSDGHYAVLGIQVVNGMVRVFDEIDSVGATHGVVIHEAALRDWWPAVRSGIVDPHVSNVFGSESPTTEWWDRARVRLDDPPRVHVEELIKIIKSYLKDPSTGKPRLVIDAERCPRTIWELEHWRRKKTNDGQGIPGKTGCDFLKALGYFLTDLLTRESGGYSKMVVTSPNYS